MPEPLKPVARARAAPDSVSAPAWRRPVAVTLAVALALFATAYAGGAYDLVDRSVLAIAVWWAIVLPLALGLWPLERVPSAVTVSAAALAALAVLAAASSAWAESAERALGEFNRVTLFLGVFLLAALASSRRTLAAWSDGLALGLAGVATLALASRFFHGLFPTQGLEEFLPGVEKRLSFPVGYWNGLAILVALAVPLLLRAATSSSGAIARSAWLAPVPAVMAVPYLASSRGGYGAALIGALAYLALSRRRWASLGALAVGSAGSAAALLVLERSPALVDGPLGSPAAADQGVNAAFLFAGIALVTAVLWGLASSLPPLRLPAAVGWATGALVAVVAVLALRAVDALARVREFRRPPADIPIGDEAFVRTHLLSVGGSGRWQFWEAAIEQFRSAPLLGRGAGSFETWWAQHGTVPLFVRDAHSLYVETLGELGLVGLALLLVAVGTPVVAGVRRRFAPAQPGDRDELAALAGCSLAFLAAAAVDWVWELTVISAVGVLALGLLARLGPVDRGEAPGRGCPALTARRALGATVLVAGWLVIASQAMPLLAELELRRSYEAAGRGSATEAFAHADSARAIQPWSARPRLQMALVQELAGRLEPALASVREAIRRDPENWRLWLVAARLETKSGDVGAGRRSLERAERLNPRSPLFRT